MPAASSSAESMVALFEAITRNLEADRADLNQLDRDDGDSGDNIVANFRMITSTLSKSVERQGGKADIGAALAEASQVLREQGQGATAPIYAEGLEDAAARLQGRDGFTIDDLLPLLEGLLSGVQRSNSAQPGEGSLLDALVPGILSYIQAKREGQGELEAILGALLSSRKGANSTARSPRGYGKGSGRDTRGEVDPGAAGAASVLEGLFGALLKGGLSQGGGRSGGSGSPLLDMVGSLFGGGR